MPGTLRWLLESLVAVAALIPEALLARRPATLVLRPRLKKINMVELRRTIRRLAV